MLFPSFIEEVRILLISTVKKYSPAVLSALMVIFSFAPFDLFFLIWFSLIPYLFFIYKAKDYRTVFRGSLLFGFIYFFGNVYWIYHSLYHYGSVPLVLSYAAVVILSLYLALYPVVFSLIFKNLIKNNLPSSLYAPFLWVSLEVLRTYLFTGFPWALLGYSQYKFLPLIQIADITGIYGISYLIVLFNCFIFDLLVFRKRRVLYPLVPYYTIVSSSLLVVLVFLFVFTYGVKKLSERSEETSLVVSVIQGNIPQDQKWDQRQIEQILSIYKNLTIQSRYLEPQLVIWPETAVPFIFERDKTLTEDLINFTKEQKIYLLFGSILEREKRKYTNSVVLLDPNGVISYYYDKIHLVPFGEYVPLRKILFFVDKLTVGTEDYTPGDSYNVAITPFGNFATLICYEIIFPGQVRKFYQKGGSFIVNITNDGWFGKTSGPYQHFAMAVFRAVENRKPLIRAANSGISGFVDSKGRVLVKTNLFERTYLVNKVNTNGKLTFYTKYGDIFAYFSMIISLIFIFKNLRLGGKRWLQLRI